MNDSLNEQLDNLFQKHVKSNSEILMNILTLVIFDRFHDDIGKFYKIVGTDIFSKLLNDFSDRSIRIPNKEEFLDAMTLAIIFYYKEMKNMPWIEIQKQFPYEKNLPLKYGKRLAKLSRTIKSKLNDLFKNKDDDIFFN